MLSSGSVDLAAMSKLSYGLFILTAKEGNRDNGCVINTAIQVTEKPLRVSIAVHKANLTHDMIGKTGEFNVSILTERAPFRIFEQFGFHSGRDVDKFASCVDNDRTANGIRYLTRHTNGVISAKVTSSADCGTHSLFVADVTEAAVWSDEPSVTYQYYFDHIKRKPPAWKEHQQGFVCKICGYVYEGDTLPGDFVCPVCKHDAGHFEQRGP